MAGIRNTHAAPPRQKEAVLPEHLIAMLETLDSSSLRDLRDQAILPIGLPAGCAAPRSSGSISDIASAAIRHRESTMIGKGAETIEQGRLRSPAPDLLLLARSCSGLRISATLDPLT